MTVQWFIKEKTGDRRFDRLPKWLRSVALAEDGEIYAPAAIAGAEMSVFLCASYDGVPGLMHSKHAYFPVSWLAREFPDVRHMCGRIEQMVREATSE